MRLPRASPALLQALFILTFPELSLSKPYPKPSPSFEGLDTTPSPAAEASNHTLVARCQNPCGWSGQLCCETGQTCGTDANNQAICQAGAGVEAAAGQGYWQYYTSTWVETDLVTHSAVYSTFIGAPVATVAQTTYAPQATASQQCQTALNESPCGEGLCCPSGYYCLVMGSQCAPAGGGSSFYSYSTPPSPYSAPLRPTSSALIVVTGAAPTATPGVTATLPFESPVATGADVGLTATAAEDGGGLSGGAIAGIVIGVIAGIILLLLILFYCCLRAGAQGVAALFGGGKKRSRRREEYVEEYHHSSAGGGAPARRWYGDRPSRPSSKKNTGGLGGLGGVAAGLGALGLLLGLKRRRDRKRDEKSDYSGSGYYSSDYTSSSK